MIPMMLIIAGGLLAFFGRGVFEDAQSGSTRVAYSGGSPFIIEVAAIGQGFYLRKDAAMAFLLMAQQAAKDGVLLSIASAFRTNEQQAALYKLYLTGQGNLAAAPGHSNHQNGIAVDINVGKTNKSKVYLWLDRYAGSYGFVNVGKYFSQIEYHHWEYKGVIGNV